MCRPTKVAIFGDMGVYSWNNMANMQKDVEEVCSEVHVTARV